MADSDNNQGTGRNKRVVYNIVYSILVFFAAFAILVSILDPSALSDTSARPHIGSGGFLSLGLAIVFTILFSAWFAKRNSRKS